MTFGEKMQQAKLEKAAREAAEAEVPDTIETVSAEESPVVPMGAPRWQMADLRAIVASGMSVAEATALLDQGFAPEAVLELAALQARQRLQSAADAQTATAKAMQKAMRPENEQAPGVSAFSYAEGDRAHPKVVAPFEFFYNGYPCHKFPETQHYRECELMAEVTPGVFSVLRKDGSLMEVTVTAQRDADQRITRLSVSFRVGREDKWLVPPMSVVLYQLAHPDAPRQRFIEAMNEWLTLTLWAAPEPARAVAIA